MSCKDTEHSESLAAGEKCGNTLTGIITALYFLDFDYIRAGSVEDGSTYHDESEREAKHITATYPRSARSIVAVGPARTRVKSTTRTPLSGGGIVGARASEDATDLKRGWGKNRAAESINERDRAKSEVLVQ